MKHDTGKYTEQWMKTKNTKQLPRWGGTPTGAEGWIDEWIGGWVYVVDMYMNE